MFGGLCFMVNDKMCVGAEKERMMVRFDPALNDVIMENNDVGPMDVTKLVMKGLRLSRWRRCIRSVNSNVGCNWH